MPDEILSVLQEMLRDPILGPLIEDLERDSHIAISFVPQSCEEMAPAGGGHTELDLGPRGGVDRFEVTYNVEAANLAMQDQFGLNQSLYELVAHELGHVSSLRGGRDRELSDRRSVEWENEARKGTIRPAHGLTCRPRPRCSP